MLKIAICDDDVKMTGRLEDRYRGVPGWRETGKSGRGEDVF